MEIVNNRSNPLIAIAVAATEVTEHKTTPTFRRKILPLSPEPSDGGSPPPRPKRCCLPTSILRAVARKTNINVGSSVAIVTWLIKTSAIGWPHSSDVEASTQITWEVNGRLLRTVKHIRFPGFMHVFQLAALRHTVVLSACSLVSVFRQKLLTNKLTHVE
jgi:hypothetical protein